MIRTERHGTRRWLIPALLLVAGAASAEDFQQSVPAEPGGRLRIRLDTGQVEVESHERDQVRVDARSSRPMRFELSGGGEDVDLVGRKDGWSFWTGLLGDGSVRVRVRVPQDFSLDVDTSGGSVQVERLEGEIRARTSGGDIGVEGAQGRVELRTSGGSIRAEEIEGDIEARTSGGGIHLRDVEGEVRVRTSGGSLVLLDVQGPIEARTSGGSIEARFEDAPEGSLETSGGSIEASFDADAGVDLDARTSGGSVDVEHPIELRDGGDRSRVRGRINGGGSRLRLRTSGGDIRVRID